MASIVMFCILAAVILGSAVMCVTTKHIMRSVTFLLFVLLGVAGLYFLLDYTYLGAAQISVYAGGMVMMYIFAVQLVSKRTLQGLVERVKGCRALSYALICLVGLATVAAYSSRMVSSLSLLKAKRCPCRPSARLFSVQTSISMYCPLSSSQCSCWHVSLAQSL